MKRGNIAVFLFLEHLQGLRSELRPDRNNHLSTNRKLFDQRLGHGFRRRRYDNCVKRRMLRPAHISVTDPDTDILIAETRQIRLGPLAQRLNDFDRVYMLNNLGIAYERSGRGPEALAAFTYAAHMDGQYIKSRVNRARLMAALTPDERASSAEYLAQMKVSVQAEDATAMAGQTVPSGE